MKKYKTPLFVMLILSLLFLGSCGPIIISPSLHNPPPPWFYPNRIESVRYVYFPEYVIYYDLSVRQYLYLENNVWIRVSTLPLRYRNINLKRSKFLRIKGYRNNNIRNYHRSNYSNSPRSSRSQTTRIKRRN
jgi:hypothetical protein